MEAKQARSMLGPGLAAGAVGGAALGAGAGYAATHAGTGTTTAGAGGLGAGAAGAYEGTGFAGPEDATECCYLGPGGAKECMPMSTLLYERPGER